MRQLRRRFPEEPYRQRLGAIAERLRRTRAALTGETGPRTGGYAGAEVLDAELASLQHALVADGLGRVAWGEVAELRWQLATFGFHLASLEVRQHAAVHRAALDALGRGADPDVEVAAGVTLDEVLATFRAIARLQDRFGIEACRRYVISFTTSPDDVAAVLELARRAAEPEPFARPVARPRRPPAGPAGAGRRAAARERGRPRGRDGAARRAARRRRLPRPPPRTRRRAGGHARLLRLVQGERLPGGELAALPGPGGARRQRAPARHPAHPVPRARRRPRAGRRPGEPGDPRAGTRAPSTAASSSPSRARSSRPTTPIPRSRSAISSRSPRRRSSRRRPSTTGRRPTRPRPGGPR